jgi:hypothetical protein
MNDIEHKAVLDALIKKIKLVLDPDRLRSVIDLLIRKNYNGGMTETEDRLKLEVNVAPNKAAVDFISNYTFDLVKGMSDEMANKLQGELARGLMNGESSKALAERVKKVMKVTQARANAIARTESHRAYNTGSYDAAKQSGLELKKKVFNPRPETAVCRHLVTKAPIGIDEKFSFQGDEWLLAPFHPNCRSKILYVQDGDEE